MTTEIKKLEFASGVDVTSPQDLVSSNGSGTGEINAILSPSRADGWAASGAGIAVATTDVIAELPLSPTVPSGIKVTLTSGTNHVRYRFTMPEALKNKKLKIGWYQRALAGYNAGDLRVEIYKNSASNYGGSYTEFPLSTDVSGHTEVPDYDGRFTTTFDSDTGDYYELRFVRVAGTGSIVFSVVILGPGVQPLDSSEVEYVVNTDLTDADTVGGTMDRTNAGAEIPAITTARFKDCEFVNDYQQGDTVVFEYTVDSGDTWQNLDWNRDFPTMYTEGTNTYGVQMYWVDLKTVRVQFGVYRTKTSGTYASGGLPWSDLSGQANVRWRLRKTRSTEAVGFALVSQNQSGLVARAGQLRGTNTNDNAGAGFVGEEIVNEITSTPTNITSGTTLSFSSITLTAGEWIVYGRVVLGASSAVTDLFDASCGISTNTIGFTDIFAVSTLASRASGAFGTSDFIYGQAVSRTFKVSTTQVVRLNVRSTYTGGQMHITDGYLVGRRVR